jgi:hypothetical protein
VGYIPPSKVSLHALISYLTPVEIVSKCPWFLEMHTWIAQRLNIVPTGLSHSTSEANEGVIFPRSLSANNTGNNGAGNDDEQEEGEDKNDDDGTSGTPIEWPTTSDEWGIFCAVKIYL